jgi:hypothetical protein
MGDEVENDDNKIILMRLDDKFKSKKIGVIEIYNEDLKGNFPLSRIENLKSYKDENSLNFAFLVHFDSNNHIKIREVDNNDINYLDLDYNS